jgi:uncharacterized membrane protein
MTRKYYLIGMLLTATVLVATIVAYPRLPSVVPTHWNVHGQANDYSAKWTLFLFGPGMMIGTMVLFYFLPWLSPKHWDVDTFQPTYLYIMLIMVCLLAYINGVTLWTSLGHGVRVDRAITGGVCLLFALLGNVLGKVRRNFFIGVRTPWSLADDRVWNATNRFAAKTFVAGGLLGLGFTVIGAEVWWTLPPLLIAGLAPIVYSLVIYKQLERRGEL